MSTYLDDGSTVFTTLCIGDGRNEDAKGVEFRDRVATQIQSILKFTHHDVYVITDKPSHFGNYFGKRAHFIQFDETMTDLSLVGKQGQFNFNLKMVPIKWTMENIGAAITVYMDADTFLFGWDRLFYRFFPQKEEGIWGRFRHALNDSASHNLILEKIKMLGVDATNISTRLPVENVMFFKQGVTMSPFFDAWYKWAKKSYEVGARTDFEAIEMTLAIHDTAMPHTHMDNALPYVDNFRTLHHGRLHIPFII